jgi:glycosyltransferase involved in cell wall biosynthesis
MRSVVRVLHVTGGNLYGGVETALVALARYRSLCPALEPQFALSFPGRFSQELGETGVAVHQLGEVRTRKPWTIWAARRRLRELLRRERFDVVICHAMWPMAIFGKAARSSSAGLAFWAHDAAAINGRHWLERWAGRVRPDLVIGNSLYTLETVPAVFPGVPSCLVHYPVKLQQPPNPSECRAAVRREMGISGDTVVVIQVSRMEAWKGHQLQLEGLSRLKSDPRWICWMVGGAQRPIEQEYMRSLQQAANELGIGERIRFLGQRSDVGKLLIAADIFSQPNKGAEPFGIVFIEALSAGLPVVTTAMGGPKEIIDDSCGMVVPPERADQLSAALRSLIDSRELRMRLGGNGPERARQLCDPAGRIADLRAALGRVARS